MNIRTATLADAAAIADIYNPYIANTIITYELDPVTADIMAARIATKQAKHDWIVAEEDGQILGYAYYGTFRERAAYNHVVEASIYLAPSQFKQGLGTRLYQEIIARAAAQGYREMIAGVALPNAASVALHNKMGFTAVGVFERSGYKFGRYLDTGFWQKSLL